jgi:hypothetical protein
MHKTSEINEVSVIIKYGDISLSQNINLENLESWEHFFSQVGTYSISISYG